MTSNMWDTPCANVDNGFLDMHMYEYEDYERKWN